MRLTAVRHRSRSQSTAKMTARSDANCSRDTACRQLCFEGQINRSDKSCSQGRWSLRQSTAKMTDTACKQFLHCKPARLLVPRADAASCLPATMPFSCPRVQRRCRHTAQSLDLTNEGAPSLSSLICTLNIMPITPDHGMSSREAGATWVYL